MFGLSLATQGLEWPCPTLTLQLAALLTSLPESKKTNHAVETCQFSQSSHYQGAGISWQDIEDNVNSFLGC